MSTFFRQPTPAPAPGTKDSRRIALFYAAVIVVMAVAQLFTFDHFLELTQSFGLPVGIQPTYFFTALLVATEVFALPFLIGMPLSRAFRWVSMVSGWIVALLWVKLSFWLVLTDAPTDNVGFLGTVVNLMPGWWALFLSLALVIMALWASWGMWPGKRGKARKK